MQVAKQKPVTDPLSFLKPFAWQLWVAIAGALLVVALASQLLARLSPLGRYEVRRCRRQRCRRHPSQRRRWTLLAAHACGGGLYEWVVQSSVCCTQLAHFVFILR